MTRPAIETRILALYTGGSEVEPFSISEIARAAKAAYPHTHRAVSDMINTGMLTPLRTGRSLFCSVNLDNDRARNLLCRAQMEHKEQALRQPNMQNLDAELRTLMIAEPSIIASVMIEGGIRLIVTDTRMRRSILRRTSIPNITFSTVKEVTEELLQSLALLEGIFFYGYERILLAMIPIAEQLMLNHASFFRGQRRRADQGGGRR